MCHLKSLCIHQGTWFLFDVLFYGNTLFEPLVLKAAFGSDAATTATSGYELLQTTVRDSLIISLLSLPGYFVTVLLIGRRICACRTTRSSRFGSASCCACELTPGECHSCWIIPKMHRTLFLKKFCILLIKLWHPINSLHSNARIFCHVCVIQYNWPLLERPVKYSLATSSSLFWNIFLRQLRAEHNNFLAAFCYLLRGMSVDAEWSKCRGRKTGGLAWCLGVRACGRDVRFERCDDVLWMRQSGGLGAHIPLTGYVF